MNNNDEQIPESQKSRETVSVKIRISGETRYSRRMFSFSVSVNFFDRGFTDPLLNINTQECMRALAIRSRRTGPS